MSGDGFLAVAELSENARVQDVGRRHKRKGRPSAESARILDRYQRTMRTEMVRILLTIEPSDRQRRKGVKPPEIAERAKLWDLAIKLARELGSEIDVPPPSEDRTDSGAPAALHSVDT